MASNFNTQYPLIPNSTGNKFLPQNQNGVNTAPVVDPSNPWRDFGFMDKDKFKENAAALSEKAIEKAQDNSWFRLVASQFGISDDPKKAAISAALTVATVVFLAWLGNSKLSVHKMTELGLNINDIFSKGKTGKNIGGLFKHGKELLSNGVKTIFPKTCANIAETFKNRPAKAKWNVMGYGDGIFGIFPNTPIAIIKNSLGKLSKDDAVMALRKLVGNADVLDDGGKVISNTAENFYKLILEDGLSASGKRYTRKEVCKQFVDAIAKNFNCIDAISGKTDKRAVYDVLCALKKGNINGVNFNEFTDVLMDGDIISSWGPANLFNMVGSGVSKLFGKKWKNAGRGNLGDALIKYGISSGAFADNKLSSLVQKSILFPTETITNFVNDKSTFGLFLCGNLMNIYNDVQDAPKEKRAGTLARGIISSLASFIIATPFAYATTYKLATFGNLSKAKGSATIFTRVLKLVGNFFNMGLNKKSFLGGVSGIAGGALRFWLIQNTFTNLVLNPVNKLVAKIFGEAYDPIAEEAKKDREESVKNLNMTEEEMLRKLQAHPEVVQAIENDTELQRAIEKNPVILLQIIASLPDAPTGGQNFIPSPMLVNYVNNPYNHIEKQQQIYAQEPVRTYIPSSKPFTYGQKTA